MKKLGPKTVSIKRLALEPEIVSRAKDPHVISLAKSVDKWGCLHRPWVRQSDMTVVFGRDRVSAHLALRRSKIEVEFVECTPEEARELADNENAHRRHDQKEQAEALKRLVADYTKAEEAKDKAKPPRTTPTGEKRRGRPKSARKRAIEKVAEETGRSPEALRQTIAKAEKADSPETRKCPIKDFGIEMDQKFNGELSEIMQWVPKIRQHIVSAEGELTRLLNAGTSIPSGPLSRIKEELAHLLKDLALLVPYSVCPWCKGTAPYQDYCAACLKMGWVPREVFDQADKALKSESPLWVMDGGEMVRLEFAEEEKDPEDDAEPEDVF
jgi:flagellar biosynthesis GTPase FlhF